jgi:radical SAM superfamily enzyme YgiQ (UPF0313 family)
MLRILLIDVGYPQDEFNEPIGIEKLAGAIEQAFGKQVYCSVKWFQMAHNTGGIEAIRKTDILGISSKIGSYSTVQKILHSARWSQFLRKPRIVLVGDMLATLAFDSLLAAHDDVICILGEGEEAIVGLIEICLKNDNFDHIQIKQLAAVKNIPNLAFTLNHRIVRTQRSVTKSLGTKMQPKRAFLQPIIEKHGLVVS